MKTALKLAIMTFLGLLPSMCVISKPSIPKPVYKLAEVEYVNCAFWLDEGHTLLGSTEKKTVLFNVDKTSQTVLKNMPLIKSGYLCAGGKQVVAQLDDGVALINPVTIKLRRLGIVSADSELVAIDYMGTRAIITSPAGSSVYDLVSGERICQINQNAGFEAKSFDKQKPGIIYGDDKQYGEAVWDMLTGSVTPRLPDKTPAALEDNPVFFFAVYNMSYSSDVYVRIISAALMYHSVSLLSRNSDPLTQHYRYICTFQMDGSYIEDQQTGNRIPLPGVNTYPGLMYPDPSGKRLLIITKAGLSVMDIASRKTIYQWKLKL
ncbi:MAG: hypothetical protein ACYC1M_06550 [Armatimonadota bacterium]